MIRIAPQILVQLRETAVGGGRRRIFRAWLPHPGRRRYRTPTVVWKEEGAIASEMLPSWIGTVLCSCAAVHAALLCVLCALPGRSPAREMSAVVAGRGFGSALVFGGIYPWLRECWCLGGFFGEGMLPQ